MFLLGYDIGSSSVKANIVEAATGKSVASAFYPKKEMEITAQQAGWAEQHPDLWWKNLKLATKDVIAHLKINPTQILAIGISYQMHGLICVDEDFQVLRPSIIWCDSRAVPYGKKAFNSLGKERVLESLLNSPGNFTASKLAWVKENEPDIYTKIYKIMLPGDYIAWKLTNKACTTISGLSEGILWDFQNNRVADLLLGYFGFDRELIPEILPTFSEQGRISPAAAAELGLIEGIPVSYRAGDQPNNALSLNVLEPGEIAATAGTSGVVYGVSDEIKYDQQSRVNTFAHVNHEASSPRLGVLLCVNGTGILNSWLKEHIGAGSIDYPDMNEKAATISVGSEGLTILPFGNGAERMLNNKNIGSSIENLNFNIHTNAHVYRASQEGIVFSLQYGMDIMNEIGIKPSVIRAGKANMFLSPIFRQSLANISGAAIELYETDGSQGAALGAGYGAGIYESPEDAFDNLEKLETIEPETSKKEQYQEAYENWKKHLINKIQ